jgi:methionyl-tRNA formyltransferase
MRIVYLGTPEFAVPPLAALVEAGFRPVRVYAQPDRPAGRGQRPSAPPVKRWAEEHGLPVEQPLDANGAASLAKLREIGPDLVVVVAYGLILSPEVLAVPRLGAVNLHASLLPDYRGASPVARAILDGRRETGVTTLWMDEGIDTGPVIFQRRVAIGDEETAGALGERLSREGGALLVETVRAIERGEAPRLPQDRAAGSYCRKLRKEEGAIDWTADAERVVRHVRAMTPWPGAFTGLALPGSEPLRVEIEEARALAETPAGAPGSVRLAGGRLVATAGRGGVEIVLVRPAGGRSLPAADWWRGLRLEEGRFARPSGA